VNKTFKTAARIAAGSALALSAFATASMPAQASVPEASGSSQPSLTDIHPVTGPLVQGGILNGGVINGPLVDGPLITTGGINTGGIGPFQFGQFQ